ncbi:cytochrome-c oxidase, cbb3-type subunit III [Usitatibacter palustris]|uniref:Cbb3-type cytochrome c oxidase subunit n=1 Tax=Usitatibacter palustris TaxID=2732487 RepID=A0A6M4H3X6_9PROT|nr:cytochrome-c oxidase, cbb3-type subunit III [Usitatibacter palustris]QJR14226.1 Cbb3-type cytochrome c oxidase subunit CcoP [Usitatibacter palustris]
MSDFTDGFWSLWVAGLSIISILFCALLLTLQGKKRVPGTPVETTGHQWDENLTELNNPLPLWWMWLFWITIGFGVVYLVLYPGLGSFPGVLKWSSSGEYATERAEADALYGPRFQRLASLEVAQIAKDPEGRLMGERLFLTYCSQCHGSDARGAKGYPDLTAGAWLYGGDAPTLVKTILDGRQGMMPPMGAALGGPEQTLDMAHYVLSLSGAKHDAKRASDAKPKFAVCAACHGADAKGNVAMGAPNLTDKIWLHGGSVETIAETIAQGRSSRMPAHREFLGEEKSKILAGYVYGISRP